MTILRRFSSSISGLVKSINRHHLYSTGAASSSSSSSSAPSSSIPCFSSEQNYTDIRSARSRLLYQCKTRGILENCILLGDFATERLPSMDRQNLKDLAILLDENDWDIYYWASGEKQAPKDIVENPVFQEFSSFVKAKKVRAVESDRSI